MAALLFAAGNTQLDRMFSFGVPVAAIVFSLTGVITIAGARFRPLSSWWVASIGVVTALAIGFALAGEGDQASGRLELPARGGSLVMPALSDSNEVGEGPKTVAIKRG